VEIRATTRSAIQLICSDEFSAPTVRCAGTWNELSRTVTLRGRYFLPYTKKCQNLSNWQILSPARIFVSFPMQPSQIMRGNLWILLFCMNVKLCNGITQIQGVCQGSIGSKCTFIRSKVNDTGATYLIRTFTNWRHSFHRILWSTVIRYLFSRDYFINRQHPTFMLIIIIIIIIIIIMAQCLGKGLCAVYQHC
jgi:hypothetical protein